MPPNQLKETTMNPKTRTLIKVNLPKRDIYEGNKRKEIDGQRAMKQPIY